MRETSAVVVGPICDYTPSTEVVAPVVVVATTMSYSDSGFSRVKALQSMIQKGFV